MLVSFGNYDLELDVLMVRRELLRALEKGPALVSVARIGWNDDVHISREVSLIGDFSGASFDDAFDVGHLKRNSLLFRVVSQ